MNLSSEIREGWGEGVFNIVFYFSLSYSDLIGNKLISQVKSVLFVMVISE